MEAKENIITKATKVSGFMSTKENVSRVTAIKLIAERLENKTNFNRIELSQALHEDYRETGANDLIFIKKECDVYFYTSKAKMEKSVMSPGLKNFPTYVGIEETNELFELSM